MKQSIQTSKAPSAIGPYSQAIQANGFLFISGQLPIDPDTNAFPGEDAAAQTKQSLINIRSILSQAGLTMDAVVKTTVYLTDFSDFADMNAVYAEFFTGTFPARVAIEVSALPKNARVEIDAIAVG